MISRKTEPLNPDIEALLRVERRPIAQGERVRARAFARMRRAVADPSLGATRFHFGAARFVWPAAAAVVFGAVAAAAVRVEHRVVPPGASSAAGVQTKSGPRAIRATPTPQAAASAVSAPVSDAPAPLPSSGAQSRRVGARASDAKASASVPSANTVFSSEGYAQELALLQPSRAAIARGDFAGALRSIAEHSRQFPSGLLGEEREALRVRALSGLHRNDEAGRAAATFRRNYPRSVFLRSMEPKPEAVP